MLKNNDNASEKEVSNSNENQETESNELDQAFTFNAKEDNEPMISDKEDSQEEKETVSDSPAKESVGDEPADKARIPYSRFEKINEAKIRAEERLALLQEQLANSNQASSKEEEMPDEWKQILGDSEEGKTAYSLLMKMNEKSREEETNRILTELEKRQNAKQQEIEQNLESIESGYAAFEEKLGRSLTEAEESALLDIQDKYTPKDEKGNYLSVLMSPEQAFEIYNLQQQASKAEKSQARKRVTAITGASSEGETNNSSDADYNPLAWGNWHNKL